MLTTMLRATLGVALAAMLSAAALAQDLVIGLGANVTSIDPHYHNLSPNSNIAWHIFDRLVHMDEKQRPIPGLATGWRAIDDTTWEFKLRPGVKFHDGSDFTADDVVATLKRVPWVPNSPSAFTTYTRQIKETIVVDPYTIRFKTERPFPLMPVYLALINIVSRKYEAAPTNDFNGGRAAVGTGPFKFIEYVPGDRIVLARNDGYWGAKPYWARVTLKLITNDPARVAALLAGDVQMIDAVPTSDSSKLKTNPSVTLARTVSNRIIYLHVDSFRPQTPYATDKAGAVLPNNPLKDKRVRQAISKAINRPAIVERLMEGEAIPAGGLLPEGFFGVSPKLKPEPFDPEGARKLLAEAGYPQGFGLTIHGPNDRYVNDEKILQSIGPMLNRVGIDTRVVTQPSATYFSQSGPPAFAYTVMMLGWAAGTGETSLPLRAILATFDPEKGAGLANRGRYSNLKLDQLLGEALQTVDDPKRDKLLQEASEIGIADYGMIPLHFQVNLWALRKGLAYTPRADEYTLAQFVRPAN